MKLLLNTIPLNPPITGIGNYTLRLLEQFQNMSDFERIDCFDWTQWLEAKEALKKYEQQRILYFDQKISKKEKSLAHLSKSHVWREALRNLPYTYRAKQIYLNSRLRHKQRAIQDHIYHEPNFIVAKHNGPIVTTIHDLSVLHYPQYHPVERAKWFKKGIVETLKRANQVLTVSHLVRDEMIERFNVDASRVHTTYLAADARFQPRDAQQTAQVLKKYDLLHGKYLLFVGTIEPRKGVMDLLDAWEQLPNALRKSYPLVLAGGSGWRNEEIMLRIQQLVEKKEVKYVNYISNEELPVLLSGCLSFVFPAVYEGFGLPVLEAMASGVPVLCRQGTSMAEFAQGSVLLHENNTESLAHQLAALIENAELRQAYAAKGLTRSADFSWEKCAQQTVDVYKRCV